MSEEPIISEGLRIEGADPRARRAALLALSEEELAARLHEMVLANRAKKERLLLLAPLASLPAGEVMASPFGMRAVAMGVAVGATTVHRELRRAMPRTPGLEADPAVWDPEHGTWEAGALHVGKYQAFRQDDPLATYDPRHHSKWGPHELLHRAVGFFHREGCSRWELYLGARLNEAAPVALWYGPDQFLRLDEEGFDRRAAATGKKASLERALWLRAPATEVEERGRAHARHVRAGVAAIDAELNAIDEELRTGAIVRRPSPFPEQPTLDSSSDATAYVVGHYERLREPATERVLSELLASEPSRAAQLMTYRAQVAAAFDQLLFKNLVVVPAISRQRRRRRQLWDLFARAARLGEEAFAPLSALIPEARRELEAPEAEINLKAWFDRFSERLRDEKGVESREARVVFQNGWLAPALGQLKEGVRSFAPLALEPLGLKEVEGLSALAGSSALWQRAPLAERVLRWAGELERSTEGYALLEVEAAISEATAHDDRVERLSILPEELDPEAPLPEEAQLVRSEAFRLREFQPAALAAHAGEDPREAEEGGAFAHPRWLLGAYLEGVSLVPAPDPVVALWEALEEGPMAVADALPLLEEGLGEEAERWLRELLGAGALGLFGPPSLLVGKR